MKNIFFVILMCVILMGSSLTGEDPPKQPNYGMVIHGGSGTIKKGVMSPEMEKAFHQKMKEALEKGYHILKKGGSSMDAVEQAIIILEDSPLFNAGKGAVFTSEETHELDASIMDGKTLQSGATSGVKRIKNPITLARKILENSPHVFLVGDGAENFGKKMGVKRVSQLYFYTERRYNSLKRAKEKSKNKSLKDKRQRYHGTVGAVALDQHGNLAAGTSTGGMTNKKYGRVGDSPIIGAGTYAHNQTCAISATGHGEYFIRAVVAHDISALMEYKKISLKRAAMEVVINKLKKMGGSGGIIGIDKDGNMAMIFNTSGMNRGYVKSDGTIVTKIYKD